jgi:hypothetical protein
MKCIGPRAAEAATPSRLLPCRRPSSTLTAAVPVHVKRPFFLSQALEPLIAEGGHISREPVAGWARRQVGTKPGGLFAAPLGRFIGRV